MGGTVSSRAMLGIRRYDVWAQRVLAAPSIATSSEWRGVHRLKDVAKRLLNLLCKSTTLTAYSRAQCRQSLHRTGCEKAMLSTFSTECRTRQPMFLGTFFKKYRKKELKKNTSEQLRLRTAVEFGGELKRVFCPYSLLVSRELVYYNPSCHKLIKRGLNNFLFRPLLMWYSQY